LPCGLQLALLRRGDDDVFRAEALDSLRWLKHGFGTRLSAEWLGTVTGLATAKQIHSDRVLLVEAAGPQGEGDALISNLPGISLAIRTADCLPVLIADPRNRAVGAIHAGWRGVVSDIVSKSIDFMHQRFGSQPEDLVIAIGTGIGPCCFEVGPEVAEQFIKTGRTKIDLIETTCRQLGRNGVSLSQISVSELCSYCNRELFESYRRDREAAGRMTAIIGIAGKS
jgi:polyphenol oxidase